MQQTLQVYVEQTSLWIFWLRMKVAALKRRELVTLNRLRNGHGRCEENVFRWEMKDYPACDCGHPSQTICFTNFR